MADQEIRKILKLINYKYMISSSIELRMTKTTIVLLKILLCLCAVFSIGGVLFHIGIIHPLFGYAKNYQQINEVIVNLSYSYLAGLIFYILNDGIPSYFRKKKAMSLIASKLQSLYSNLDWILAVTKLEANLDKENNKITLSDCSIANNVTLHVSRIAIFSYIRINSNVWNSNPTREWYDTIFSQAQLAQKIKEIIVTIQTSIVAKDLNNNLMSLLYQIQNSEYLTDLEINKELVEMSELKSTENHNGQQKLFDFIQMLLKLNLYNFDKHEHKLVKMNESQKEEYNQFLASMKPYIDANIKRKGRFKVYKGYQKVM